jgi:hypothetical protein
MFFGIASLPPENRTNVFMAMIYPKATRTAQPPFSVNRG